MPSAVDPAVGQALGVGLAVLSAISYAVTNVLVRRGRRPGLDDHGLLLTMAVNLAVLVPLVAVMGIGTAGSGTAAGLAWFALSGVLATLLGRGALFGGIARVGSARTGAVKNAAPAVAVLAGVAVLGERLGLQSWGGIVLCLAGIAVLVWDRRAMVAPPVPPAPMLAGGRRRQSLRSGLVWGMAAAVFFGLSQVARKLGVVGLPDAVLGSLVAASTSIVVYVVVLVLRGRLGSIVRGTLRSVNVDLVGAGVASTVGMLSFVAAVLFLPVSEASVLAGAEALFTVALAALVLRRHEVVSMRVAMAGVLIFCGAAVLATARGGAA